MVLQSLVVALIHDLEYEGNGCPERKVSERPFLAVIETA
jgi:hypothetical protein